MTHLLDTDVIINHLKRIKPIPTNNTERFAMSVITYAELLYGIDKSPNPTNMHNRLKTMIHNVPIVVLSLTPDIIEVFSKIKVTLERAGKQLEDFDLLIAATAIAHNLTLVTGNKKHFQRIKSLSIA